MRFRFFLILFVALALSGCAGRPSPVSEAAPPAASSSLSPAPPSAPSDPAPSNPVPAGPVPSNPAPEPPVKSSFDMALGEIIASANRATAPGDVLRAYFELQYLGYSALEPVDLSLVLDTHLGNMYNLNVWLDMLIQRRRLLYEQGLCYVERGQFPFDIEFIEAEDLTDGRLDAWRGFDFGDNADLTLHFVIRGEPGRAYPPLMAVNAQHSARLRRDGDTWRVTFHYFPGAGRKFYFDYLLEPRGDETVLEELLAEFAPVSDSTSLRPHARSQPYRGLYAARYAARYTETHNEGFYRVDEWNGNCMNFISQCVLHGFGDGLVPDPSLSRLMTAEWFSGGGGGTPAWENVDFFWEYATSGGAMRCQTLESAAVLRVGDLIQTRNRFAEEAPEDYGHCLLVADARTLLLAQNTPATYVYYADLVNTAQRYIRPLYLG